MLLGLQIRDFAIVDRIDVEFSQGMTVLTGETGAGKSILVDALGLVLGDRGSPTLLRSGAKRAEFSAEFDISLLPHVKAWLVQQELDEDDACLLRRVINADGRSRGFINGNAVPLQQLKKLGEMLLDIHGQHFHQSLGRRDVQREQLDHFGALLQQRAKTEDAYHLWRDLAEQLQKLRTADSDRASRLELLDFQLQELDALAVSKGEFEELQAERQKLQNSGKLADGVSTAIASLYDQDDGNVNSLLAEASRAVRSLAQFDAALQPVVEMLESASIQVSEATDSLRRYAEGIDMDPAHRDQVEERLDAIHSAARKHRVEAEQLYALRDRLRAEFEELNNAEERGREIEQRAEAAETGYRKLATTLTAQRKKAAARFSAAVSEAMSGLGMPGGVFNASITPLKDDDARAWGVDNIEFLISANPGQPAQPLSKVASGGELSRMSLAIQVIASDGSNIPCMIFDEVDSGVGGGVAEMVGRRLQQLGESRQVLCVTHLPQVASLADQHFRISKVTDGKATRTGVQALSKDERIEELARMLGGVEITTKTLEHAAEMLAAGAPQKRA
ncbi:MAG: DNA repair protein RecN [Woeseiaceae bacterium]